jgi:hypothetical protein
VFIAIHSLGSSNKLLVVSNVQSSWAAKLVPAAAIGAGLPESSLPALFKALPLGSAALAKVPGITTSIMVAAGAAVQQTYVHALRVVALSSLSFGILAIIACICCNDIGEKVSKGQSPWLKDITWHSLLTLLHR